MQKVQEREQKVILLAEADFLQEAEVEVPSVEAEAEAVSVKIKPYF